MNHGNFNFLYQNYYVFNVSLDILFQPFEEVGRYFLEYRRRLLWEETYHWNVLHSPGPEVSESKDIHYLESLEPTQWKVRHCLLSRLFYWKYFIYFIISVTHNQLYCISDI